MLPLFALFLPLINADSIILQNDCKRTTEQCFITLEVIKGEPKKDCAVFSTFDRQCAIGTDNSFTELPSGEDIQITQNNGETVITWTGKKTKGDGTETSSLSAASIWQRIKRQIRGQLVNCTCSPVGRQKRNTFDFPSIIKEDLCTSGFKKTNKTINPTVCLLWFPFICQFFEVYPFGGDDN